MEGLEIQTKTEEIKGLTSPVSWDPISSIDEPANIYQMIRSDQRKRRRRPTSCFLFSSDDEEFLNSRLRTIETKYKYKYKYK
jgi:hypothetical protein